MKEFEAVVGGFCLGGSEDGVKVVVFQIFDDNELALVVGWRLGKDDILTSGVMVLDTGCTGRIGCRMDEWGPASFNTLVA